MKRIVGTLLAAMAVLALAQSETVVEPIEFRVGSTFGANDLHRTMLWFRQTGEGAPYTVLGVTGPNGHPVPASGAFSLDLSHMSEYTMALYEAPQPGTYVARFAGPTELEVYVEVGELAPLALPVVTRLDVAGSTVDVEWEPVPGATEYLVFLMSPGSRSFTPLTARGPETTVRFTDLPADTYEVTIEARDHSLLLAEDEPLPANPRLSVTTETFHVRR